MQEEIYFLLFRIQDLFIFRLLVYMAKTKLNFRNFKIWIFSIFCLTVLLLWFFSPLIIDKSMRWAAKEMGFDKFDANVLKINPWHLDLANVEMNGSTGDFTLERTNFRYDPVDLMQGRLSSASITGLEGKLSIRKIIDEYILPSDDLNYTDETSLDSICEAILKDPILAFLRVRKSKLHFVDDRGDFPLDFLLKLNFHEDFAHGVFDGEFDQGNFLSEFRLWKEDAEVFLDGKLTFPNLEKLNNPLNKLWGLFFESTNPVFEFQSGSVVAEAITRVMDGGILKESFIELNASEVALPLGGMVLNFENFIGFVTPTNVNEINFNGYANLKVDDEFHLQGANIHADLDGDSLGLRASISDFFAVNENFPIHLHGFTFPHLDFNLSRPIEIPSKVLDFHFDDISVGEDLFKLYDGHVMLRNIGQDQLWHVRIPPITASMPKTNLTFVNFSYDGILNLMEPFTMPYNQVLSGPQILLGDEAFIKDFSVAFKTLSENHILVDSMTAKVDDLRVECQPAGLSFKLDSNHSSALSLMLDGTRITFPQYNTVIKNIRGKVDLQSIDPFITDGVQVITFEEIQHPSLTIREGNFTFEIIDGEQMVVHSAVAHAWGGELGVSSANLNFINGDTWVLLEALSLNGQDLVDLFARKEVKGNFEGNFSGSVKLSNLSDLWDFGNGYLQLVPAQNNRAQFEVFDLLVDGLEEGSEEMEKMKLTAWALEDLHLNSASVNLKVFEDERQILISLDGIRETSERKVDLKYRPKIIGGLHQLLKWQRANSP